MMKFKKFLAASMTGLMMFGAVATAAPAIATYAAEEEAATKSTYEIAVDYITFSATISKTAQEDAYIILEVLKENKDDSKVSATYTYPVVELDSGKFGAVVDLSFLKVKNDTYIRVRGNSEEKPTDIKIVSAQQPKFSMKYTPGKKTLAEALVIDKAAVKADDLKKYQYRTMYGSVFEPLNQLDKDPEVNTDDVFKSLEIAGTTIIVRRAAVNDAEADTNAGTAAVVGAPASPEVKVKIAAAPKAPKVTIDYAKGTIKLPKNVQLQLITEKDGAATVTDWVECSATAVDQEKILGMFYKVGDDGIADADALATKIGEMTASGFTVAVRVKTNGKKADSNPTILTVKGVQTLAQVEDEEGNPTDEVKVGDASLKWKATKAGIEYTVVGSPFEYKDGDKWKALKVGTVTVKGVVTADKQVEVRVAGVKTVKGKEGTFPSSVAKITVKKYTAPVKSVEVKLSATSVAVNGKVTATVTVKDESDNTVSDPTITWTSSDEAVATIDENGSITGKKAGTATITCTCDGKSGTAQITVTAK